MTKQCFWAKDWRKQTKSEIEFQLGSIFFYSLRRFTVWSQIQKTSHRKKQNSAQGTRMDYIYSQAPLTHSGIEPGFLVRVCLPYLFPIFQDDFPIFQDNFPIFQDNFPIFQDDFPTFYYKIPWNLSPTFVLYFKWKIPKDAI